MSRCLNLSTFWKHANFEGHISKRYLIPAFIEYAIVIGITTALSFVLDSTLGTKSTDDISAKWTIDTFVMLFTGFIPNFVITLTGKSIGTKNPRIVGNSLLIHCGIALAFSVLLIVLALPLRVPCCRLLGMSNELISKTKWYYIIEFCITPLTFIAATLNSVMTSYWWFAFALGKDLLNMLVTWVTFYLCHVRFHLGLTGAALVTAVPVIVTVPIMIVYILCRKPERPLYTFPWQKQTKEPESASLLNFSESNLRASVVGAELHTINPTVARISSPNTQKREKQKYARLYAKAFLILFSTSVTLTVGRMISNSFALKAPSEYGNLKSTTPGLQSYAIMIMNNIVSIPMTASGIISSLCLAIATPLLSKNSLKSTKYVQRMYFVLTILSFAIGVICAIVYACLGYTRFISSFIQPADVPLVSAFSKLIWPFGMAISVMWCLLGVFRAFTLSSTSFKSFFLAEVISLIIFYPMVLVGGTTRFGSVLPVCFWLALAETVRVFSLTAGHLTITLRNVKNTRK
ncbi:hypothetical protein BLNAU_13882 [Blattamonas nauphoetae]|uniref:Uncharacterized protein n=1 Tax=Blattamonas nauphoetae TaxID=2049346 RepID=A0ABQ9XJY7_9EUKA|nr:hypothetical protein BLNAU_13882 [Blattamonas nauphoetae]